MLAIGCAGVGEHLRFLREQHKAHHFTLVQGAPRDVAIARSPIASDLTLNVQKKDEQLLTTKTGGRCVFTKYAVLPTTVGVTFVSIRTTIVNR